MLDSGLPQDGLNEHVFDPRDVARYVTRVEPEDGRSAQFLDDPVWVHFSAGHVEHLVAQYGRTVDLRVSRTDPAPQSTPAASGTRSTRSSPRRPSGPRCRRRSRRSPTS